MRIQILSDVHLELRQFGCIAANTFPATAPVLALLGDIGDPSSLAYADFLLAQAERFDTVLVLCGNHEYYGRSVDETHALVRAVCERAPAFGSGTESPRAFGSGTESPRAFGSGTESPRAGRLVFLDQATHVLGGGLAVLGATLWSDIADEQRSDVACFLADFRYIRDWNVEANQAMHKRHVAWLQQELSRQAALGNRVLVLTHHAPSFRGTSALKHAGSPLSSAFATNLEALLRPPVVAWCFGHTHHTSDQTIQGVRVVSNQMGYPGEALEVQAAPSCVIEV
jgi:predicted phosphodiesterase